MHIKKHASLDKAKSMRIAIGGSAANPVHIGHVELIGHLMDSGRLDRLIWRPTGLRPDKPDLIEPAHRVAMTMLAFPQEWLYKGDCQFTIDFSDVYKPEGERTIDVLERFQKENPEAEVAWFTGADSVVPQDRFGGKCEIEATWHRGEELMRDWKFIIVPREDYPHPSTFTLPSQFEILGANLPALSSSEIVRRIKANENWEELYSDLNHPVVLYIKRYGLYK